MKKLLWGMILVLAQSACSTAPLPEDHYYRLEIIPAAAQRVDANVTVQTLVASGVYNERPLLYSTAQAPTELRQYHYHYWADLPARMIREQLTAYLRAAQAPTVGAQAPHDYQLSGTVLRFEQRLDGSDATAIAAIELVLRHSADAHVLWRKTYRADIRTHDNSPLAASQGLSQALGSCFAQLVSDLRRVN